ncbi:hypothetical protein CA600_12640 [Paenibacillus sp. VTT E-133280]|uniref:hypothetical protein n=1 Tax=Paenibacillus sp. VTT E-133280 TaxID=1986222 RepID=UPI000B9FC750|nr:hypothetical protein [Paenibacillus sp. VTT E-133280]OZQ66100.1 hypothetical protein CA600_12640 [Paenibacillus sp. VTT E-133280]
MLEQVIIEIEDIEKYLDEHEKSLLSGLLWKIEQLKAIENDPNQLKLDIVDHQLITLGDVTS